MRVHEAAHEFNVSSTEIMDLLEEVGMSVKTASSNIPIDAYDHLEAKFGKPRSKILPMGDELSSSEDFPEIDPGISGSMDDQHVKVVRIGEDDEAPEAIESNPDEELQEPVSEETALEEVGEDEAPKVEDKADQVRRIIRDKAKILLRTKIRKSQRPIAATKDAIRREIQKNKESRFEDVFKKRREEEERQRKLREEEERKRKQAELEAARAAKLEAERLAQQRAKELAEAKAAERAEAAAKGEPEVEAPVEQIEEEPVIPVQEEQIVEMQAEIVALQKGGQKPADKKPRRRKHEPGVKLVSEDEEEAELEPVQEEIKPKAPEIPILRPHRPRPRVRPHAAIQSHAKWAWKREKRQRTLAQKEESVRQAERAARTLYINETTTVADIAKDLKIHAADLIKKLLELGLMVTIQQRLDLDTVYIIADEYGYEVEETTIYEEGELFGAEDEDGPEDLILRPPVVTVMGHVDHGKTKLLDAIRKTDVVSGEAGGITQHIGAYQVQLGDEHQITFLDTPGHEAFTTMRARGAMVTDIVVLVVAANEGVMPQTVEAINHAKAAEVPIIVAVNKIDLPDANVENVKQELTAYGLVAEDWGGSTMFMPISALRGIGIQELLEAIILESEILELKANPDKPARGTIIESEMDKGRGAVATVLIQEGTLQVGDSCVTGVHSGKIRVLNDDKGVQIKFAGPSTPVEILGMSGVPQAGDPFLVVRSEKDAKAISLRLQRVYRERELRRVQHVTLESLYSAEGSIEAKRLNIIVRGDVHGSVEALCEALERIASDRVSVDIIHSGVGAIVESDVMLASASNALIIGFNVRANPTAQDLARREHVEIRCYRLIYQALEEIKAAMLGLLDKEYREEVVGRCLVNQTFRASKYGMVAGCHVLDGRLFREHEARLLRDNVVVHEGKIDSLRRFKEDVGEVGPDLECGVGFKDYDDIKPGDIIECFRMVEVEASL